MTRALVVLGAIAVLAGCATDREYTGQKCGARGLASGTAAYAECVAAVEGMLRRNRAVNERYGGSGAAGTIGR
ncbi:MAG: hypothetical protein FJX56_08990 [Alphaproteobacteria bacterium]|nr:hypothetical protein [Alphaproteobacteria bacterium]